MYFKRYLNGIILNLKTIRFISLVPLIILNILIPLLNFAVFKRNGINEELYRNLLQYSQYFMPFFSVWNVIFILREYVESDGKETLYVCSNKCKIKDILGIFLISIINIAIIFIIYGFIFPTMYFEFLRIVSICILFLGITYSIAFLGKSITPVIMVLLLYTLASILSKNKLYFPLFYTLEGISKALYMSHYFILLLIGVLLLFIGTIINKKFVI